MEREDGFNAGWRRIGSLALALIPWALAVGALAWLAFAQGWLEFLQARRMAHRAAVYVGAEVRPKEKIKIDVLPRGGCVHVVRADIDGGNLLLYAKNDCHSSLDYLEWHWQTISPAGTVLHEDEENWRCPKPSQPGDSAECRMEIRQDDRIASLRVWVQTFP